MSASSRTRQDVLTWTTRVLAEFLGADVAFLRRNDHQRGLSILEAEWPPRDIPSPDPLGEVPFDADPVFAATKNLRKPYLAGVDGEVDYLERVEKGSGVPLVGGACVPLLLSESTWGVLGFLHFGLHKWTVEELSALQAIASMLVQLQARIDAEERTEYIALHDDLTGLPNRRSLLRELEVRLAANRATADPLLRPRPLQGDERLPGPRQRRPGADDHRRPHPHQHPAQRLRGPARRRRVRDPGRRCRQRNGSGRHRLPVARRHRRADRLRRTGSDAHRQHRHRALEPRREERDRTARMGRRGPLRRQAAGAQPGGRVRRGSAGIGQ